VTNTGPTTITGNLGTGGTSITGFPPGIYTGAEFTAGQATTPLNDGGTAYAQIAALNGAIVLTGDLGGQTLSPGTYSYSSSAALTGTLTLLGTGSSTDAWYFQIGSSLVTATGSSLVLSAGALACNIYWQVGSSATLGTGSLFQGNILARISITADTAAVVNGSLFGLGGSVTLDSNLVSVQSCPVASTSSTTASTSTSQSNSISSKTSDILTSTLTSTYFTPKTLSSSMPSTSR